MESSHFTKSYYKIKDAAEIIGVSQSTLRFWEKEFPEIKPRRSAHNQRYFSPEDLETLQIVKFLVKDKGLKIEAAKESLRVNKKNISRQIEIKEELIKVREELQGILHALNLRGNRLGISSEES